MSRRKIATYTEACAQERFAQIVAALWELEDSQYMSAISYLQEEDYKVDDIFLRQIVSNSGRNHGWNTRLARQPRLSTVKEALSFECPERSLL